MAYLVLARKWRPRTFEEVVGQSTVTRTLKNALASGRIGHAFLLSGARGVGKTTTARILAKALNCAKAAAPTPEPCGECPSCAEIAAGTSLDVQEIDGATHNGVEQVRELRESARYNPARDRFKIWIIDEVHMLSTGAFNALLKTLEEPPPRVKFIFATTEYHKIPDTILSRCQQYDFRLIPAAELQAHLRRVAQGEGVRVSDEALARIARAAEGSARDALSLFDQVLSFSAEEVKDEDIQALLGLIDRELLLAASRAVAEGDSRALLELVERLSDYGADPRNFARELLLHFREILLAEDGAGGRPAPLAARPRGPGADAPAGRGLLRGGPAAHLRGPDRGRDRPAPGPGPARHPGAGAAEDGADAPAGAVRRAGGEGGPPGLGRERGAAGAARARPSGAAGPPRPGPARGAARRRPIAAPAPAAAPSEPASLLAAMAEPAPRPGRRWPSPCAPRRRVKRATRSSSRWRPTSRPWPPCTWTSTASWRARPAAAR